MKVSGEMVANNPESIADEGRVYVNELSHVGHDCQLTLKLPGRSSHLSTKFDQSVRYFFRYFIHEK